MNSAQYMNGYVMLSDNLASYVNNAFSLSYGTSLYNNGDGDVLAGHRYYSISLFYQLSAAAPYLSFETSETIV